MEPSSKMQQMEALEEKIEYSNEFDLRKPLERQLFVGEHIDCVRIQDYPNLAALSDHCYEFLSQLQRNDSGIQSAGRIAIQSLCAPQCGYGNLDWEMLSFIRCLKSFLRTSNAIAVLTFPAAVLPPSFSERWKHLADTLLSVSAIPDEDKDLAQLLSGYQDMVGFLNVHKVAQLNTQVPVILEARTFSLKLQRRRSLVLERLNQAPVDGSSRDSYETSGSCSGSSKSSPIDF
ncbi:hypothetical protein Taro_043805 [Colocasia esculenta]|uniref:Elongator complex protein 4 n=1 Tax=Colocasia esculenta TaxID=4460 RepID=A0A843X4L1_COLES|nr:hypothetical protein [Colocasia esculenta]